MIHGLRIYPQTVDVTDAGGVPMYIHGWLSEDVSDLWYIFRPLASALGGQVIVNDFALTLGDNGFEDPMPKLRERYGAGLVAADIKSQLMLLAGDSFGNWAPDHYVNQGELMPIFRDQPSFDLLKRMFWEPGDFGMSSTTWPDGMRAVIHMWDDIYWQLFSTEQSDLDLLISAHHADPRLQLYYVDLDLEYPHPSGEPLHAATLQDGS